MKKILTVSLLTLVFAIPSIGQVESETPQEVVYNSNVQPEFPGGQEAMSEYISTHIEYPQSAIENKVEGIIYVQHVIEKDGSLTNFKVLRGGDDALVAEALRVIKQMPKWTPGKDENGNLVRVSQILPVKFALGK